MGVDEPLGKVQEPEAGEREGSTTSRPKGIKERIITRIQESHTKSATL